MTVSAGLDVHKDKCHGVIMDEDGEILKDEKFENSLVGIREFFNGFKHADMVMESSYSWRPTYERLEEIGLEAKLAHPKRTRAIAESEIKIDSIDARTLAHLLRTGLVHEAYVPSKEIRDLRDKVRIQLASPLERERFERPKAGLQWRQTAEAFRRKKRGTEGNSFKA